MAVSNEEGGSGSAAVSGDEAGTAVLRLNAMKATFTFKGVDAEPVPSVLRGFSAPVQLEFTPPLSTDDLLFILANDTDPFNRWEASQMLARGIMTRAIAKMGASATDPAADVSAVVTADDAWQRFAEAGRSILAAAASNTVDRAWVEEALSFPGVSSLVQELAPVDPLAVFAVVKGFGAAFASACAAELAVAYETCKAEAAGVSYEVNEEQTSRRSLASYALRSLGLLGHGGAEAAELAAAAANATNMTETVAALSALSRHPSADAPRKAAFDAFLNRWKDDNNVICTYLSLVSGMVHHPNPLELVKETMASEVYSMKVPNKFYALVGGGVSHIARSLTRSFFFSLLFFRSLSKAAPTKCAFADNTAPPRNGGTNSHFMCFSMRLFTWLKSSIRLSAGDASAFFLAMTIREAPRAFFLCAQNEKCVFAPLHTETARAHVMSPWF